MSQAGHYGPIWKKVPRVRLGTTGKRVAIIIVVALVGVAAWRGWVALSGPPARPHIILISIDTLRADHVGCYGYPEDITPALDSLAADGVRFENAYGPVPLTLPSHTAMLTGSYPPYTGVHKNETHRLSASHQTLPELLSDVGYVTGAIVSTFVLDSQFGLDQGFQTYQDDMPLSPQGRGYSQRKGEEATELAIDWLDRHAGADGLFLLLHYYDPHTPYEPPEAFARFGSDDAGLYAGEVAYSDHCVGLVIDKLKELGLYEDCLIIVTSDHGEMLGEHGELTHGYFVYESAVRVPLIIKAPDQVAGGQVADPVGLIDLVPTICSLLGVPAPESVQGVDLTPYLTGSSPDAPDRYLYCESAMPQNYDLNGLFGVVGPRWKFIDTTRPELYDLRADPTETADLSDQQAVMARTLSDQVQAVQRQRGPGDGRQDLDAETRRQLESLGYVASDVEVYLGIDPDKDDPKDWIAYHLRVLRAIETLKPGGDVDGGIEALRELVPQRPQVAVTRLALGRLLIGRQILPEALEQFDALLALRPTDAEAHSQRGFVREQMGDLNGAMADYNQAIALDADQGAALLFRGRLLSDAGQLVAARADLDRAVAVDPELPGLWYVRGITRLKQGDPQGALADLTEALDRQPYHVPARLRRAQLLAAKGQLDRAIADWTEVLAHQPDNIDAYVLRGIALHQSGRTAEAIADIRAALGLLPADAAGQRAKLEDLIRRFRGGRQ